MILTAIIYVTLIGAACAAVLCIFSKLMAVKVDERVAKMLECLPGSNCGACGYPGCEGYAKALASDTGVKATLCPPGGPALVQQLSEILGVEAEAIARKLAVVRCRGDREAQQQKMDYDGIETCAAAKAVFCGEGACAFGCLGYADCQVICPADAVCMESGLARICSINCSGCGLCVKACPQKLITIEDDSVATVVMCENLEKGAIARKKCSKACIGCRKCERECQAKAIVVKDNLARIDQEACTGCGHCAKTCVTGSVQLSPLAADRPELLKESPQAV